MIPKFHFKNASNLFINEEVRFAKLQFHAI